MSVVRSRNLGQKAGAQHSMVLRTIGPLHNAGISAANDASAFIADRAYRVVEIKVCHVIAATAGAKLSVNKCTGTQTPAAGTALIKTEASPPAGFNTDGTYALDGTINTVRTANLVAVEASLRLAAGDRLALDLSGTISPLEGLLVQIKLLPLPDALYWLTD